MFDPETEKYAKEHADVIREYTMGLCQKCGAFYIPRLGHTKENCRKCRVKAKVNSNANKMLGAYHDYYHNS